MTRPVRFGVLGAARIAGRALIVPARDRDDVVMAAVAARDLPRAEAYAQEHGCLRAHQGYEALIADPEVDVIYNALPPHRHADLTIAALKAGKPVLCEKPFAMNAAEARAMVDTAKAAGLLLMEAFHYRYHPMFRRILEVVRSGELGRIRRIEAVFDATIADKPGELRYDASIGGGALMDLGTYPVHWARQIAGSEPTVAGAARRMSADGRADIAYAADLAFANGISARIATAMDKPYGPTLEVIGDEGRLYAVNPLSPQSPQGHMLMVDSAAGEREETFITRTSYAFQLDAFLGCLRDGAAPPTGGEDSVAQMAAIDAIRAAGEG